MCFLSSMRVLSAKWEVYWRAHWNRKKNILVQINEILILIFNIVFIFLNKFEYVLRNKEKKEPYHIARLKGIQESDGLSYECPGRHSITSGWLRLQTITLVQKSLSLYISPSWHGVIFSSDGRFAWSRVHGFVKLEVSITSYTGWSFNVGLLVDISCLCISSSLSSRVSLDFAKFRGCQESDLPWFSQGFPEYGGGGG